MTRVDLERVRHAAREIYSSTEVAAALQRMAAEITRDLAARDPIVVAVMQGGLFTALHLAMQLAFPHEFDYLDVRRYGAGLTGGDIEWRVGPKAGFRNRTILLVDDVIDRGVTLAALRGALDRLPVAETRCAVLVRKIVPDADSRPAVDYVGLEAGPEYLFGCGMDYRGYWRNLPSLYALGEEPG